MNRYSKNAMPQLARMTSQSGELLNFGFKLPYHANVMKTFEQVSNTTGNQRDEVKSMPQKMNSSMSGVKCQPVAFRAVPEFLRQTATFLRHVPDILRQLPESFRTCPHSSGNCRNYSGTSLISVGNCRS